MKSSVVLSAAGEPVILQRDTQVHVGVDLRPVRRPEVLGQWSP
jgi:hypothetical protein